MTNHDELFALIRELRTIHSADAIANAIQLHNICECFNGVLPRDKGHLVRAWRNDPDTTVNPHWLVAQATGIPPTGDQR